jgi:hypothetical protein
MFEIRPWLRKLEQFTLVTSTEILLLYVQKLKYAYLAKRAAWKIKE